MSEPKYYIHPDDIIIEREESSTFTHIWDRDGERVFALTKDFTDKQIKTVINFANEVFRKGFNQGELSKIREIKNALSLK